MYISIDPGEHVGVATFREDGSFIKRTTMSLSEFRRVFLKYTYLEAAQHPNTKLHFIMENFKLTHNKALDQTGSNMPAPRCIGAVEMIVDLLSNQAELVLVPPGNLRTALTWAGFPELANKPRTWHCPDDLSAYSHGVMYLIQQGLQEHPIFKQE
jgi:hypothetical protein